MESGSNKLITVVERGGVSLCSMGRPDFALLYVSRTSLPQPELQAIVTTVLANGPFNLTVERQRASIWATRTQAPSEVLRPYREWVTVRVDVAEAYIDAGQHRERGMQMKALGLVLASTILVNRQNTSRREDWAAASEMQERAYLDAIRARFREATKAICPSGGWIDHKIYNCDLPSTYDFSRIESVR
jgi:hypothetical protein